jgi:hypothetical protein
MMRILNVKWKFEILSVKSVSIRESVVKKAAKYQSHADTELSFGFWFQPM